MVKLTGCVYNTITMTVLNYSAKSYRKYFHSDSNTVYDNASIIIT